MSHPGARGGLDARLGASLDPAHRGGLLHRGSPRDGVRDHRGALPGSTDALVGGLERPGTPVGINDGSTNPFVLRECPPARGGSGVKGGRWPSEERSPLVAPSLSRRRHSRPSTWRCPAASLEAGSGPGQTSRQPRFRSLHVRNRVSGTKGDVAPTETHTRVTFGANKRIAG